MNRRTFLAAVSNLAALGATPKPSASGSAQRRSTSKRPPRKVIVGTAMQSFWGQYPGLRNRLDQLAGIVDQMAAQSKKKYGRGFDLAVLPETAITGEAEGDALARSVPFEGQVQEAFTRKAREHECYIVVPTYLLDSKEKKLCSNAAILVGRKGETLGAYRKIHLVVSLERGTMEGGATPGDALPVFDCDFGKLGIQICYDMEFEDGWTELARRGAELIAWPTQSPQTSQPAFRAKDNRCYIVSSTWRHNASVFEPTGKIAAQIKPD
jgi:predicted amidohydrolase